MRRSASAKVFSAIRQTIAASAAAVAEANMATSVTSEGIKQSQGKKQVTRATIATKTRSKALGSRAILGNRRASHSLSPKSSWALSSGLKVSAVYIWRLRSLDITAPTTDKTEKKTKRTSTYRWSATMPSLVSLKTFIVTQRAAKMAVKPTQKGRNAFCTSALANTVSCWAASATACAEWYRAMPLDRVPELSAADARRKMPHSSAGTNVERSAKGTTAVKLAKDAKLTMENNVVRVFFDVTGTDIRKSSWSRNILLIAERSFRVSSSLVTTPSTTLEGTKLSTPVSTAERRVRATALMGCGPRT
mmetsp:Transcript_45039/g.124808  ORF Transcript_45039/g.124808 Transcript_45039/m.124808 type:complete len:305 (-) Transcript_45039:291-1205(-)